MALCCLGQYYVCVVIIIIIIITIVIIINCISIEHLKMPKILH